MRKRRPYISEVPELIEQWDYDRNKLEPSKVTIGSHKEAYWICPYCKKSYPALIQNKGIKKGRGCRECTDKRLSSLTHERRFKQGVNDLKTQRPDLLLDWDYELNDIDPSEVAVGSGIPSHWKCHICGYTWVTSPNSRTTNNSGCKKCGNRKISEKTRERAIRSGNTLQNLYPDIAAEWHPTLNGEKTPDNTAPSSNDRVWWKCATCGNVYLQKVDNRTGYKHAGCNKCNKYMHSSFAEQAVFFYVRKAIPSAINGYDDLGMEFDIFLPQQNTVIEYDGGYWHRSEKAHVTGIKKYALCKNHNLILVRIKENYKRYAISNDDCDIQIVREDDSDKGLEKCITNVLTNLHIKPPFPIVISEDRATIKNDYIVSLKERSLQYQYPSIASEWDNEKNGSLTPDMIRPGSGDKVWWKCSKCGESYQMSPAHRTGKKPENCPVCAGKKIISGINDLASKYPKFAAEWDFTKNGDLKPDMIAPNYSKKVYWKCANCGKPFYCTPNKRVSRGQGCRDCKRTKKHEYIVIPGKNDLATLHPAIALDWDYTRNKDTITTIKMNNKEEVYWICHVCGTHWLSSVYDRVKLHKGCPQCKKIQEKEVRELQKRKRQEERKRSGNNLLIAYPEIAKEWNYDLNGDYLPEMAAPHSNDYVWWRCTMCGNEWPAYICNRTGTQKSGCPRCRKTRKEKSKHYSP